MHALAKDRQLSVRFVQDPRLEEALHLGHAPQFVLTKLWLHEVEVGARPARRP